MKKAILIIFLIFMVGCACQDLPTMDEVKCLDEDGELHLFRSERGCPIEGDKEDFKYTGEGRCPVKEEYFMNNYYLSKCSIGLCKEKGMEWAYGELPNKGDCLVHCYN